MCSDSHSRKLTLAGQHVLVAKTTGRAGKVWPSGI